MAPLSRVQPVGAMTMAIKHGERPDVIAWRKARENVTYTDGTRVQEGDSIRYHQAPGGLMARGDWRYGVAAYIPWDSNYAGELHLLSEGRFYILYGHVIERHDPATLIGPDGFTRLA